MRRAIVIAMVIFGVWALISGISQFFPPFDTLFDVGHVVSACVLGILMIIHVCLNFKTIVRYFKGLGRWWILIGVMVVGGIIFEGIIVTIFMALGVWD